MSSKKKVKREDEESCGSNSALLPIKHTVFELFSEITKKKIQDTGHFKQG